MNFLKDNIFHLMILAVLFLVMIRLDNLLIKIDTIADDTSVHYGQMLQDDDVPE